MSATSNLRTFLSYRGDQDDTLGMETTTLTYLADALLLSIVVVMLVRNTWLDPHPFAWLLGGILTAYGLLLLIRPRRLVTWRVTLMAVSAIAVAMVVPIRVDEHVLVTSFLACLGCMAMFFAWGAFPGLLCVALYVGFVAVMMQNPAYGFADPGHTNTMIFGISIIFVVALVMQHHFVRRLEANLHLLSGTSDYLQQSIDGLHYAAAAGSVGIWSFKRDGERWNSNEIFRDLMDLPAQEHPELTSHLIRQRLADEVGANFIHRCFSDDDAEFELVDVLKRDGSKLRCQVMSKVYHSQEGNMIRRGVLVAFPSSLGDEPMRAFPDT